MGDQNKTECKGRRKQVAEKTDGCDSMFVPGEDEEIMLRYGSGDSSGIDGLIKKHEKWLSAFFYKRLSEIKYNGERDHLIYDMCQDTFVRALRHPEKYEAKKPFYKWVATSAWWVYNDWYRKYRDGMKEADNVVPFTDHDGIGTIDCIEERLESRENDDYIFLIAYCGQLRQAVDDCSSPLSPKHRDVLALYLDHLVQREMAHNLQMALGKVNQLLGEAYGLIVECLEGKSFREAAFLAFYDVKKIVS